MRCRLSLLSAAISLAAAYVLLYPFLFLGALYPPTRRYVHVLERWYSYLIFYTGWFRIHKRYATDLGNASYVFCANHTSYLDVPALLLHRHSLVFVGKTAIRKVPLFGFVYRRLHINVDRESARSKYDVLRRSKHALAAGYGVAFFPEGGIASTHPPALARFKPGAFRLAIEAQVPIVPVTIFNNWTIFPKYKPAVPIRCIPIMEMLFHEPIPTQGLQLPDAPALAARTKACIHHALQQRFPNHMPAESPVASTQSP